MVPFVSVNVSRTWFSDLRCFCTAIIFLIDSWIVCKFFLCLLIVQVFVNFFQLISFSQLLLFSCVYFSQSLKLKIFLLWTCLTKLRRYNICYKFWQTLVFGNGAHNWQMQQHDSANNYDYCYKTSWYLIFWLCVFIISYTGF